MNKLEEFKKRQKRLKHLEICIMFNIVVLVILIIVDAVIKTVS
jgi:hypothetical protein